MYKKVSILPYLPFFLFFLIHPLHVVASLKLHKNVNQSLSKSYHRFSPSFNEEYSEPPLVFNQLLIPANRHCLYTTIIAGYLFPTIKRGKATIETAERVNQLFGTQPAHYLNTFLKIFERPTHYFQDFQSDLFNTLVAEFVQRMKIKKGARGGCYKIQTIANELNINIQEYLADPKNRSHLVPSDIIKPSKSTATTTIEIVLDRAYPQEITSLKTKASIKDGLYYQHYRLKYQLPSVQIQYNPPFSQNHYSPYTFSLDDDRKDDSKQEEKYNANISSYTPPSPKFNLPATLREMKFFPSPYEYAILSRHVYRDDVQKGDRVEVIVNQQLYKLHEWEVYKIFVFDAKSPLSRFFSAVLGTKYYYKAVLYQHRRKKQMVLAHRGTEPSNVNAWETNIKSIVRHEIGNTDFLEGRESHSIFLTKKAYQAAYQEGMHTLSFTGHSLGGWLAQISIFMFYNQEKRIEKKERQLFVKAVTFDTPGASPALKEMNREYDYPTSIDRLDITNYLSAPNLVNCCNPHVGTCYRVIFKDFSSFLEKNTIVYTVNSHAMDNFVEAFDQQKGHPKRALFIRDWPQILKKKDKKDIQLKYLEEVCSILLLIEPKIDIITKSGFLLAYCLKKGNTRSLLGKEYEGFFKILKNTSRHIDSENLDDYEAVHLENVCHYGTCHPKPYCFHARHIPGRLDGTFEQMLQSEIARQFGLKETKKKDLFKVNKKIDSRLFLDAWMYYHYRLPCNIESPTNFFEIPIKKKHLLDREGEVKKLYRRFTKKQYQVQAILGDSGMGKSTLARLYAKKYFFEEEVYTYGWWLDAEDTTALERSIDMIFKQMNIQAANDYINSQQKWKKIRECLEKLPHWLLIFDNVCNPYKIKKYLIKSKYGHILITSRHSKARQWKNHGIYTIQSKVIELDLSEAFLGGFRPCKGDSEKSWRLELLTMIERRPFTLSLIGHCLEQKSAFPKQPYKNYLTLYVKQQSVVAPRAEKLKKKNVTHISMAIAFEVTAKKMEEAMNMDKESIAKEAWRLLRVMSFLHPDGLNWTFFYYLRPSLQRKWFKSWRNKRDKIIKAEKSREAAKYLCSYGILIDEGDKSRIHRAIQSIMLLRIKKGIVTYIKDQALQLLETMQRLNPIAVASLRFEMMSHCYTLMKHIQCNEKNRIRMLRLMGNIDGQAYLRKNLYLPPLATNGGLLHQQIINFINTKGKSSPLMLLTADAGAGKSAYGCYLVEKLWEIYYKSYQWAHIPLFISLPAYYDAEEPEALITKVLLSKGLYQSTIKKIEKEALLGEQPWVFVLDGYDEIKSKKNLFTHCQLHRWGVRYSRYLISCRTGYFETLKREGETAQKLFTLDNGNLKNLSIAPFSTEQIDKYIKNFAESEHNAYKDRPVDQWDQKRYQTTLIAFPKLKDWMKTPFLLVMGLQALPSLDKKRKNSLLTKTDICDAFITEWIKREQEKPNSTITPDLLRTFCRELAETLYEHNATVIKKKDTHMEHFFAQSKTLQSAPLRYIPNSAGGYYEFIHPDFKLYFALSSIHRSLQLEGLTQYTTYQWFFYNKHPFCKERLDRKMKKNPGMATFLAESIENPVIVRQLIALADIEHPIAQPNAKALLDGFTDEKLKKMCQKHPLLYGIENDLLHKGNLSDTLIKKWPSEACTMTFYYLTKCNAHSKVKDRLWRCFEDLSDSEEQNKKTWLSDFLIHKNYHYQELLTYVNLTYVNKEKFLRDYSLYYMKYIEGKYVCYSRPKFDIFKEDSIRAVVYHTKNFCAPLVEIRGLGEKYYELRSNKEKLEYCIRVASEFYNFFQIIKRLNLLLSYEESVYYEIDEYLPKICPKNEGYRLEMVSLKNKLQTKEDGLFQQTALWLLGLKDEL